jgi:Zn-finger nucleic acid-binding protein
MSTAAACGNCGQPLAVLRLAGHYGQQVEIDLCAPCHGVWFDPVESARLAGTGLLALVGEMARAQALAHHTARPDMGCPRCRGPLRQVHNRTRWGRSLQLECAKGHGTWQSFGEFLNEKGLLRPMSSADRNRALQRGALHCVSCGGAIAQGDAECSWCGAVPALVDVARLARALDPEAATAGHAVHRTTAGRGTLHCAACGAAQPPDGGWQCSHCSATLAAPGLAEAHRAVSELGPALAEHARRPAPHVVQQRLAAQQPALDRQRERSAAMQAEADEVLERHGGRRDDLQSAAERALWSMLLRLLRDHPAATGCGVAVLVVVGWLLNR